MAIPVDFLQTVDGDLDVSLGLRQTTDLDTFVLQKLTETLAFFLGEYFLDLNKGMPYFEHVYGQPFDRPLVTTIYRRGAAKTPGVASVDAISVAFDSTTREVQPRILVRTVVGTTVLFEPFVIGVT